MFWVLGIDDAKFIALILTHPVHDCLKSIILFSNESEPRQTCHWSSEHPKVNWAQMDKSMHFFQRRADVFHM